MFLLNFLQRVRYFHLTTRASAQKRHQSARSREPYFFPKLISPCAHTIYPAESEADLGACKQIYLTNVQENPSFSLSALGSRSVYMPFFIYKFYPLSSYTRRSRFFFLFARSTLCDYGCSIIKEISLLYLQLDGWVGAQQSARRVAITRGEWSKPREIASFENSLVLITLGCICMQIRRHLVGIVSKLIARSSHI